MVLTGAKEENNKNRLASLYSANRPRQRNGF